MTHEQPNEQPGAVTVLMSVYRNTTADELALTLDSLAAQTRPAERILVVKDGPVPHEVEDLLSATAAVDTVALERNSGLGVALAEGFKHIDTEFVARLDSDDAAFPERLEKQLAFMREHPEVAVLGTAMQEFDGERPGPSTTGGIRRLPETHEEIARYARINSPMNHPSVLMRTEAVRRVGGYQPMHNMEDYDLWARLIAAGEKLHNLPEPLTYFRVNDAQLKRRTTAETRKAERELQAKLVQYGLISRPRAAVNLAVRNLYRALPLSTMKRVYAVLFHRGR
ncbi:glycosyltransferase [Corynebacterium sp. CCUG 70398]|uniref:glycosyltransferase n=1 Tax=Corynebacterium sp. CCUG 70398 TaxID=2823891 RepID=UPI00210BD2C3|nr:glycosyltransferase [Corynebacterium sp. CCUG 70398]MCQ4622581.1 glycosyltransferase [Corynebacterium sp. CCUG 70398]